MLSLSRFQKLNGIFSTTSASDKNILRIFLTIIIRGCGTLWKKIKNAATFIASTSTNFIKKATSVMKLTINRLNGKENSFQRSSNLTYGVRKRMNGISRKKLSQILLLILLIVIGGLGLKTVINRKGVGANVEDRRIEVQGAKSNIDINKEFEFPLRNDNGEEVSTIKYRILNVELRDEIVVKGQKATAVKGRTFLIMNLKISNEYNQAIQMNTRDYVRLTLNNNEEERLAPDIHNDPVEIQAISTKFTRIGFPINDTDKNLKLHVGEITGEKKVIDLNYSK